MVPFNDGQSAPELLFQDVALESTDETPPSSDLLASGEVRTPEQKPRLPVRRPSSSVTPSEQKPRNRT